MNWTILNIELTLELIPRFQHSDGGVDFYSLKDVVLAGHSLLGQVFHENVAFRRLPDLEASLGTGLAGVGQQIHDRLVVDLNEGGLQGTYRT